MGTCDTCVHWKRSTVKFDEPHEGSCSSPKFVSGNDDLPVDGLINFDGYDYPSGFATGAKFGCIHHQAKP